MPASTYRPQAPELRYFLTRFVALHFSRLRATVQRDYPDSLFFLDPALADEDVRAELADRTHDLTIGQPLPETDIVLLAADSQEELAMLTRLRAALVPNGAIWVVSRKGKAATLRDVEVMGAAKGSGLVDNKVASFSATHTSIRLVIPVALRPR